jgi:hypothetical protein
VVVTPSIPTPRSREVELEEEEEDEAIEELATAEDQPARRPESRTTKRQRELVQKTSEDALRRGLEAQRIAAAAQARMPTAIRLGCLGRRLESQSLRGKFLRAHSFFAYYLANACPNEVFAMQVGNGATRGSGCPNFSLLHEVA